MLLHAAALWALMGGLARDPSPVLVPVTLLGGSTPSPAPIPTPAPTPAPTGLPRQAAAPTPASHTTQAAGVPAGVPAPPPAGVKVTPPAAESNATASLAAPAPPAGAAPDGGGVWAAAPTAGSTGQTAAGTGSSGGSVAGSAAGSGRVELPSSDAAFLRNPAPAYPPRSRQFGEQGRVVVRVLVDAEGLPQRAQVYQSSGHNRLDQAAVATVLQWRYLPGRRAGVPEAMWLNVPISFVLE